MRWAKDSRGGKSLSRRLGISLGCPISAPAFSLTAVTWLPSSGRSSSTVWWPDQHPSLYVDLDGNAPGEVVDGGGIAGLSVGGKVQVPAAPAACNWARKTLQWESVPGCSSASSNAVTRAWKLKPFSSTVWWDLDEGGRGWRS